MAHRGAMIYDTQSTRWRELRIPDYTVVPMDSFDTLFTRVCRSHPGVHVRQHADGSRGVFATADIQPGEFLLVEHVMVGSELDLQRAVMSSKSFCANLLPRLPSDWESEPPYDSIVEKCGRNMFDVSLQNNKGDCLMALGCAVSMINHSDQANAFVHPALGNIQDTYMPYFIFIVALFPIKAGDEVFITYNTEPKTELNASTPWFIGRTPDYVYERVQLLRPKVDDVTGAEMNYWLPTEKHRETFGRQLLLVKFGYRYNEYDDDVGVV